MKLRDIINNVNKDKKFKQDVYIGSMAELMDMHDMSYCYADQDRLTSYYVVSWHCTDQTVGMKVYFFDDKPVAISMQTGRKMYEEIEWVSKEDYKTVRDFILSFKEEEEGFVDLANLDQDLPDHYKIHYSSQYYPYHSSIALYKGEKVDILKSVKEKDSFVETKVVIRLPDNSTETVKIVDLDFPYNLKED